MPVYNSEVLKALDYRSYDFLELRLDYLDSLEGLDLAGLADKKRYLILTVRDLPEGGINSIEPEAKKKFLLEAKRLGFLVDVEAEFITRYGFDYTDSIVSRHFFSDEPSLEELQEIASKYSRKASVVKIALDYSPTSSLKLVKLLGLYDNLAVMERDGEKASRLLYSVLGSKLIYTYVTEKTSEGQPSAGEVKDIFSAIRKI